ncbi:glycosyltransferase family 25 protein [Arcobacter sp.]|uniref:glycosyltransferase family 25 protein n=1 Tax=Arcobacter sp. TaxID=1872629 RepID=UPI003D14E55C
MKTFIINLKCDIYRKRHMQKILENTKLDYEFIDAIYGKELSNIDNYINHGKEKSIKLIGRPLIPGEIGCILSHQSIYKKIIKNNITHALILEDDINIDRDLELILKSFNYTELIFDIVLIGYHGIKSRNDLKLNGDLIENINKTNYLLFKCKEDAHGTYGYIISLNGAKKILKQSSEFDLPIDHYTGNSNLNNVLCIYPQLININSTLSDDSLLSIERKNIWEKIKKEEFTINLEIISYKLKNNTKKIIIYGFNDFAEEVYKKFYDKIAIIIDNNKNGLLIDNLKIKNLDTFYKEVTNVEDFIFVITALNKKTVKDIKESIEQLYNKSKIISIHTTI